jgi:hypothetical protein
MTPDAAIDHLLDAAEGLEIAGGDAAVADVLLGVAASFACHALKRSPPQAREFLLEQFHYRVVGHLAAHAAKPKTNGHANPYSEPEAN